MLRTRWNKISENKILWILIGLAGFWAFSSTMEAGISYSNSLLSVFFGVCAVTAYTYVRKHTKAEGCGESFLSGILGTGLSFALVAGSRLERVESLQLAEAHLWISWICLAVFLAPFFRFGWQWLEEREARQDKEALWEEKRGTEWKGFLTRTALLFLCWVPVFLAFYPGAFVYDATDEYVQVATRTFTTHHPLAHVLMLGGFVAAGNRLFGSYNLGIAAYTLFQMLILAGVFSYTLLWLKCHGVRGKIRAAIFLFYGFFPVITMYAVCSAKDGLFTAAFLVVILQMLSLMEEPNAFLNKKRNVIAGILAATAMMLLRNNGVYAYLVWILPAMVWMWIRSRKNLAKTGVMLVASVAVYLLFSKALAWGLDADSGAKQEILTVPIQQMVRTYHYSPEVYTQEEKEILYELFGEENMHHYNPRLSDLIKSKFNNEKFNEDPAKYLSLWIRNGIQAPMTYINAWLMTSYGYWYPDAVINVYQGNTVQTFTYEDSSYFGFETEHPGTRQSKFPWLEEEYRKMSLELYQQKVPGLSMLFSPGFLFWIYAFFMGYYLKKGRMETVVPFLLILLLWLTALLGPTYLVRYVLILWFALPVIVSRVKL